MLESTIRHSQQNTFYPENKEAKVSEWQRVVQCVAKIAEVLTRLAVSNALGAI
jgi:hypothetical protein